MNRTKLILKVKQNDFALASSENYFTVQTTNTKHES